MTPWNHALREGVFTGSLASLLSTAYLVWAGQRRGQPAAPVNAPSHWIFGDGALREDEPSKLFTLTGFGIHHAASIFWGVLHAKAWGCKAYAKRPLPAAAGALTASAVACLVDYKLTPPRLSPGFEHRLSIKELAAVYGCFAVGLAVGSMLLARRARHEQDQDQS